MALCSCIDVPIIPEIIPIQLKDSLRQIAKLSKLEMLQEITKNLAPSKITPKTFAITAYSKLVL
jgi:5,10-methylenetetrahydrofolate reductase